MLRARKTPNGMAARAINRSGNGHKYWSEFSPQKQQEIENIAQEIHQLIFEPKLENPIKTLDLPVVGKLSSTDKLELTLEFVNIVNGIESDDQLGKDLTGDKTVNLLINCKRLAQRINSKDASSLGLHPLVYFYTSAGKAKIGSFYGVVTLMLELEKTKSFIKFTDVRKDFEWIIWQYDMIPQLVSKSSAIEARERVKDFYLTIIDKLLQKIDKKNIIKEIVAERKFGILKIKTNNDGSETQGQKFSRETKSAIYIREALRGTPKCKICGGYIPTRFNSIDHIQRKADGGLGTLDNAQLTHFYCNTTYKN